MLYIVGSPLKSEKTILFGFKKYFLALKSTFWKKFYEKGLKIIRNSAHDREYLLIYYLGVISRILFGHDIDYYQSNKVKEISMKFWNLIRGRNYTFCVWTSAINQFNCGNWSELITPYFLVALPMIYWVFKPLNSKFEFFL